LQELQNKETGEIPLLHIYELESTLEEADFQDEKKEPEQKVDAASDVGMSNASLTSKPKQAFLAIAQRRSEMLCRDYLHPMSQRVFGTPLLLKVADLDKMSGRDLYDLIARRLRKFAPKSALRFLTEQQNNDKSDGIEVNEEEAEKSKTGNGYSTSQIDLAKSARMISRSQNRTTADMEEVSAGPVPRYGFRLRITSRDGRRCMVCPWYECCIGCLIPDTSEPLNILDGDSIAVDWHLAVDVATNGFGSRSPSHDANTRQRGTTVAYKNHSSCGNSALSGGQVGAITLEDCLDAFAKEEKIPEAYCSKCKDFRVQTKAMKLWRLPPIMIIHLKRFQFTQHMRRKLRDLVVFPIEGLDLSRIMSGDTTSDKASLDEQNGCVENGTASMEEEKSTMDSGRSERLYDLYGVVHHQGALSGGHYVASLKSEIDGQWRLYNDAQVYEINPRDVIDASAYILFYIRRDVSRARLTDFWDVRDKGNLSQADMDMLMKGKSDRCVIS
jgi:Ubiquitin carboxyl-terminal hydrolase